MVDSGSVVRTVGQVLPPSTSIIPELAGVVNRQWQTVGSQWGHNGFTMG